MRSSTFLDSAPKNRCRGKDPSTKTPLWTFITVFFLSLFLNLDVQGQNLYTECTGCTSEDVKATTIRFDPPANASCLNSDQFFDATLYVGLDVTSQTRYGLYIEFYIEADGKLFGDAWPANDPTPYRYAYCVRQDLPQGQYEIAIGTLPQLPGGTSIRLVDVFTGWENQSPNVGGGNGLYFCDKLNTGANPPVLLTCKDIDKPRCKTYPFLGETVLLSKPTITVTGPEFACTGSTGTNFSITGTATTANFEIELYYSFSGGAPYTKVDNFDGSELIPANSPFTVSQTLTAYLVRVKTGDDPCPGLADSHTITASIAATVDAGPNKDYCSSGSPVQLGGSFGGGASSATWTGGNGTFAPNANTPNATYVPSEAEITAGTVTLTLTTNDPDGSGPCLPVNDQMTITISKAAITEAGPNQTVCSSSPNVTLAGSVTGGSTSGTWSGGTGTFNPNNTTLNAVYTPSAAEITAGTVTLTLTSGNPAGLCEATTDQMTITINKAVVTEAGANQTVCSSSPNVTLAGSVTGGATTGTWSGGTGTFNPSNTALNAVYTPSAAEITAGTVTLTLTSANPEGICEATTDQMTITINKEVVTDAGANQTVCSSSPNVTLAGSVTGGATTGTWSGGTGSFNPNANTLNAVYTPSAAEITAGTVTLTLTSANPEGICEATTDQMTITINKAVVTEAGANQTVCAASPNVTLAGSVTGGATTGTWSGGTGSFNPSNTTLNAVYTPSAAEITAGTVTLTLTSANPDGPCEATTDQMTITINKSVATEAGPNQTVCSSSPNVTLAGSVSGGATTGIWSGGTGSFNPNANALNAVYTPSAAEITAGTVTLTLTSTNPDGPCEATTDQMTITINKAVVTEAGANQTVCSSSPNVTLAGSVSGGATTGTWSGGTGSFNPNNTTLNAVYTPSAAEITAGTVTLTLTSANPDGPCEATTDQMTITINKAVVTEAGANQTVCAASPNVTLAGSVTGGATTGTWSGGTGSFNPNANALNAVYTPSAAEITAGTVTLTLTSANPDGPCEATSDQMTITINSASSADAGPNQTVCANQTVQLAAVSTPSTGAWTGGGGSYNPNNTSPTAVYTPSAAEKLAGTVTLTWTTTEPEGPCTSESDQMTITIKPIVVTEAGDNQTVCSSSPNVTLAGSVSGGATTGTWSGGTGSFNPNANALNAVYTPSAAEITAGTVTLTLTSANPDGPCDATSDQMTITINPAVTADAGPNQTVCADQTVQLAASGTGTWTGGGGTYNPSSSAANAIYTPSSAEKLAGSVTLTWNVADPDGRGPCTGATDQVLITINPIATVDAGNPQTTCVGVGVTLTAVLGGSATSVTWSAPSGQFLPNATANPVTYIPSATGAINVTATTNNPEGPCNAATDIVVVTANTCAAGYCTYTQGGFGNEGGKDSYKKGGQCIKSTGATMTVTDALAGWGDAGMPIGNMIFSKKLTDDIQGYTDPALIIAYLPNGGPSKPYPGTKANLLKDGDKNTLLAQTITLGLNMGLNSSLGSFELKSGWLVTSSSDDCGETPDGLTTQCFKFSVSSGMDTDKDGKVTILEVFNLANKALRGEALPGGVSLSGLAGAADAVNNAFDECRVPLRWSETDACGGARNTLADANTASFGTTANASSASKELMVKAYPNPFKDRVFISFTSPVSGKATVEIFDMTGRRLEAINKGQVVAGRENTVEYTVPMSNRNSIIYRVTVDKFSVNGRLISPNK